jgi:beta-1,4-mannosyltransferase
MSLRGGDTLGRMSGRVLVLVGGDLGRSPRMLAHAFAAAEHGARVDLLGYAGAPLPSRVAAHPRIAVRTIAAGGDRRVANLRSTSLYMAAAIARAAWRTVGLVAAASTLARPDVVLVQTSPAIPGLAAARAVARLRRSRLVVDWHSFSDAVLARRLGGDAMSVRWLRAAEMRLAHAADAHIAVSEALAASLRSRNRSIDVTVAPDSPIERLAPPDDHERARMLEGLAAVGVLSSTEASALRTRTAALLVAPTSWNGDDDFQALLDALVDYDRGAGAFRPPLVVIITGAGPMQAAFTSHLADRQWRAVSIRMAWLAPDDYPRLLAAADLGLCLHRTLAGVDPPIKLADMQGAGVPACVLGSGGVLEFADALTRLLDGFPNAPALARARADLASAPPPTWLETWPAAVAPRLHIGAARPRESRS